MRNANIYRLADNHIFGYSKSTNDVTCKKGGGLKYHSHWNKCLAFWPKISSNEVLYENAIIQSNKKYILKLLGTQQIL